MEDFHENLDASDIPARRPPTPKPKKNPTFQTTSNEVNESDYPSSNYPIVEETTDFSDADAEDFNFRGCGNQNNSDQDNDEMCFDLFADITDTKKFEEDTQKVIKLSERQQDEHDKFYHSLDNNLNIGEDMDIIDDFPIKQTIEMHNIPLNTQSDENYDADYEDEDFS